MRGEYVIVRAYGGELLVRKLWDSSPRKVYVCSDESYKRLLGISGDNFPPDCFPIGFPREDVFVFDLKLSSELANGNKQIESHRLNQWREHD